MNAGKFLALSLCANLALAGTAIYLRGKSGRPAPDSAANCGVAPFPAPPTVVGPAPAFGAFATNQFHWRTIESTNYDEYVANLRALGCPEKTVRDIILADAQKLFTARRRAATAQEPFWLAGKARRQFQREQQKEFAELDREHAALIHRLLGSEWFAGPDHLDADNLEDQAITRFFFGPMPEENFQRLVAVGHQYESLQAEVERRAEGILTDEDEAEMRRLAAAMKQEFAQALDPARGAELLARLAAMQIMNHDFAFVGLDVTIAEARQIALARAAVTDPLRQMFGKLGAEDGSAAERSAKEMNFSNTVRTLLGEKRFADFERAQDRDFQRLFDLGAENKLPADVAGKVYSALQLTRAEVAHLRNDPAFDESARRLRFAEMSAALQREVSRTLGADAYAEYLRGHGAWVTNLNQL